MGMLAERADYVICGSAGPTPATHADAHAPTTLLNRPDATPRAAAPSCLARGASAAEQGPPVPRPTAAHRGDHRRHPLLRRRAPRRPSARADRRALECRVRALAHPRGGAVMPAPAIGPRL